MEMDPNNVAMALDYDVMSRLLAGHSSPLAVDNHGRTFVNEDRDTTGRGAQTTEFVTGATLAVLIVAGPCWLDLLTFGNIGAAGTGFLRLYDASSAAGILGTGVPYQIYPVAGTGFWSIPYPRPLYFSQGIVLTATALRLDADTTVLPAGVNGAASFVWHLAVNS